MQCIACEATGTRIGKAFCMLPFDFSTSLHSHGLLFHAQYMRSSLMQLNPGGTE